MSLPLCQFLLLRWYFRLFIWARFLWQVSRIELRFMPTHPDRCGGVGFLGAVSSAFYPVLLAPGTILAGLIATGFFTPAPRCPNSRWTHRAGGRDGVRHPWAAAGLSRKLEAAKRAGLAEYGTLAQRYVREFDQKWLRGGAPPDEPLVGSADIQPLADLGSSFEVVKSMRWVPFSMQTVLQLAVGYAAARVAADVDDDFAGGIARAASRDCLLTSLTDPVAEAMLIENKLDAIVGDDLAGEVPLAE